MRKDRASGFPCRPTACSLLAWSKRSRLGVALRRSLAGGAWQPTVGGLRPLVYRPQSTVNGLRPASAFTLLEIMIVIGIIAILVSMLFPVILGASAKAKEKQAMAETRTILMAIKAYRQEYGKWPAQIQAAQDTTYIVSNYCVIQPLLGSNVKNKIFLHLQVNTNSNPDYAGNYLDPWGIPYVICMDEDGNNTLLISNTVFYAASNTSGRQIGATNISLYCPVTNVDVGVASLGGTASTLPWKTWEEMR